MARHHHHLEIHVLGILGNIASLTFFVASLPTVMKMVRTKSACEEDVVSAVNGQMVRMMNCCMWVVYACVRGQFALWILLTNSMGFALSLAFLIPFCYFSPCSQRRHAVKKVMASWCTLGSMVGMMLWLLECRRSRIEALGIVSGVLSSLVHLGLLSQVKEALVFKDEKYLKPQASLLAFIKGGTWAAYGLWSMDIYIMVPNVVGVCTGCVQLLLACVLSRMRRRCSSSSSIMIAERTRSLRVKVFLEDKTSNNDVHIEFEIRPQQLESVSSMELGSTKLDRIPSSKVSIT